MVLCHAGGPHTESCLGQVILVVGMGDGTTELGWGWGVQTSFLTLESICLFEYLFVLETSGGPEVWMVAHAS